MKFFLPLITALIWTSCLISQQSACITYNATVKASSGHGDDGATILYLNSYSSLYVHSEWPKAEQYDQKGTTVSHVIGDEEGMPIYTDLSTRKQVYKSAYFAPKKPWILTETLPIINWEIKEETKPFGTLNAQSATGEYGGRIYQVWFTPDIPLPFGPHRLNGLPGVILEAWSEDDVALYEFATYHPVCPTTRELAAPVAGNEITHRMLKKYLIQRLLKTEADSPPQWNDTIDDPEDPNFEVELNKWTIFSDYKRERGY